MLDWNKSYEKKPEKFRRLVSIQSVNFKCLVKLVVYSLFLNAIYSFQRLKNAEDCFNMQLQFSCIKTKYQQCYGIDRVSIYNLIAFETPTNMEHNKETT